MCLMEVDPIFKFLRKKPKVSLALAQMFSMWVFQLKSFLMIKPRYFTEYKVSSV